jgi:hypothetical protein
MSNEKLYYKLLFLKLLEKVEQPKLLEDNQNYNTFRVLNDNKKELTKYYDR